MLGSLRARLIVSFAVVVALAVFLAGVGALLLLRDEQQIAARERFGRHAEPINERVASLLELGYSRADELVLARLIGGHVFLLGTDPVGRDILSRLIHGTRLSLVIGLVSVGLSLSFGVLLGLVAGFYRGRLPEYVVMRLMDVMLALPSLLQTR